MKINLKKAFLNASLTALALSVQLGCKSDNDLSPVDYGDAPRKPVPAEMIGEWYYSSVSGTNYQYPDGHYAPAWSQGSIFHIEADGTGFQIITADVNTPTSESSERVESDGTYEIADNGNGSYSFKFYPVRGKVYDNNVFSHDLEKKKLYPEKFFNWTVDTGSDTNGNYFQVGELTYYKK